MIIFTYKNLNFFLDGFTYFNNREDQEAFWDFYENNGNQTELEIPGLENSTKLEYEGEGGIIQQNKLEDQLFPKDFFCSLPGTGITLKTGNFL